MAKRVNSPFLIALTAGAVVLVVVLLVSDKLIRRNPKRLIALGDAAVAEGRWADAAHEYADAQSVDPSDKELSFKLGEALNRLTSQEPQYLGLARGQWSRALQIDPKYLAPLHSLLESYQQQVDVMPQQAAGYASLRDTARRIVAIDPSDTKAAAALHLATVRQWIAGGSGTVQDRDLRQSLAALQELMKKDPANPDLPYYLARQKLQEGQNALRDGQADTAEERFGEAAATLDAALKGQAGAGNAAMNWRAYEVYSQLASTSPGEKERSAYAASAARALEAAVAAVRPADAHYADVQFAAADFDARHGKAQAAEDRLRAYCAANPDDLRGRIVFADLLGRAGKRDEAIRVLARTTTPATPSATDAVAQSRQTGFGGVIQRNLEADALRLLTGFRLDSYPTVTDPAARKLLMADIEAGVRKYGELTGGESPRLLSLRGATEELKGERYAAIETFSRARKLMEGASGRDPQLYAQIQYQLAMAYKAEQQNASAEKLLEQLVDQLPSFAPARVELAQLYLQDRDPDNARRHIDALAAASPDAPDLPRLRLELDRVARRPAADVMRDYARLPEATLPQLVGKAQAAAQAAQAAAGAAGAAGATEDWSEVVRLLELALKQKPDDAGVAAFLAEAELRAGHKQRAQEVVADALRSNPANPRLLVLQKQMENASPAEMKQLNDKLLASADEFTREIQAFQAEMAQRHFDAALTHLRAAQKSGKDEKLVADLFFQFYLVQQKFPDAERSIDALAALNADDADGYWYRIRLAMVKRDYPAAIKLGQELTRRQPELARSWVLLADAYKAAEQYDDALREYHTALERQTANAEALKGEIDCYYALNQPDNAATAIAAARKHFPDSTQFRETELEYELNYGDPAKAVDERAAAVKADPDNPAAHLALAGAAARAAQVVSSRDNPKGKEFLAEARDALKKAMAKWPQDARFVPLMAEVTEAEGDFPAAEGLLRDFAARDAWKGRPEPDLLFADLYLRTNRPDAAEKALRDAWARSGQSVDVELKLASFLSDRRQFDAALQVLAANAADPSVAQQRVQTLLLAGRPNEAEAAAQQALKGAPNSPALLNLLSVVYLAQGKFDDARAMVDRVLTVDPKNLDAQLHLGQIELNRPHGDLNAATRALVMLLDRMPKNVQVRLTLADVYAKKGDADSATRALENALPLAPLDRRVRLALATRYASSDPPQWDAFDRVLEEAENNPKLNADPTWFGMQSGGLARRGNFAGALAKIREALKLAPDNPAFEHDYLSLLLQAKDYAGVEREAERLLGAGRETWWIYEARASAKSALGDKKGAMADFDLALSKSDLAHDAAAGAQVINRVATDVGVDEALARVLPGAETENRWRLMAVQLYRNKGDNASAVKYAEAVVQDPKAGDEERVDALRALAQSAQADHQNEKARKAYLELLRRQPDDVISLNNLAYLLADVLNEPQKAKTYSQRAYDVLKQEGKADPLVFDTHGWVLTRCGGADAKAGLGVLQKVVDENPDFLESRYHLGVAFQNLGDTDAALRELSMASDQVRENEAKHAAVRPDLKKNIEAELAKARESAAKTAATVHGT